MLDINLFRTDLPRVVSGLAKRGVTRNPPFTNAAVEAIASGFTSEAPMAVVG